MNELNDDYIHDIFDILCVLDFFRGFSSAKEHVRAHPKINGLGSIEVT